MDYSLENTVLEALEFNNAASWTHEKMDCVQHLIKQPISYGDMKQTLDSVITKPKRSIAYKKQKIEINELESGKFMFKCWICNTYKNSNEFHPYNRVKCCNCLQQLQQQRYYTPRGFIRRLVSSAKQRHQKRFTVESLK